MNKLINQIGSLLPNNRIKDVIRKMAFPLIFTPVGSTIVQIGPPEDKEEFKVSYFPLYKERLGEREIEGYLKYYTPKTGDVVVNAGGYHGYFALYLSKKVESTGHVYCFEPDSINVKIIKKNIARNKIKNITIIQKGLWNASKSLPFETRGSSSRLSNRNNAAGIIDVCSLDEELRNRNTKKVDFISMDIEGAEIEAIVGAKHIITANPNIHLAIASYHIVNGSKTAYRVEEMLREYGLQAKTEFPRHLTTYGTKHIP